jgi:hypothetical protein
VAWSPDIPETASAQSRLRGKQSGEQSKHDAKPQKEKLYAKPKRLGEPFSKGPQPLDRQTHAFTKAGSRSH